jgi:lysophospholipase L1-like esterase
MNPIRFLVILSLLSSNLATFYVAKKSLRPKVDRQRDMTEALARMGNAANGKYVVLVGDSIVQGARRPGTLCGATIVNAGIAGSRASTLIPLAEEMVAQSSSPALIIAALGINDSIATYRTDFKASFGLLIESLPKVPIAVATLTSVDYRLTYGKIMNADTVRAIDSEIREIAEKKGLLLIDLQRSGTFKTSDGVHLTDEDYRTWNKLITDGIKRGLHCETE